MPIDWENLAALAGMNRRNVELILPNNAREHFPSVDDKILCKERLAELGVPTSRTLFTLGSYFEIEGALDRLETLDAFAIKPSRGSGGAGILLSRKKTAGGWLTPSGKILDREHLRRQMSDILFGVYSFGTDKDRVLVEDLLIQHEFFNQIYDGGIADIRIICHREVPVLAMTRIPTKASEGKANLHQGALGVPIDLASGRLGTPRKKGQAVPRHPDSGLEMAQLVLPFWQEILELAVKAARGFELKYIGLDLVLDQRIGPLILEINARPGLEIQVVNQIGLIRAIQHAHEKESDHET